MFIHNSGRLTAPSTPAPAIQRHWMPASKIKIPEAATNRGPQIRLTSNQPHRMAKIKPTSTYRYADRQPMLADP